VVLEEQVLLVQELLQLQLLEQQQASSLVVQVVLDTLPLELQVLLELVLLLVLAELVV
jgi:hypothetical protein